MERRGSVVAKVYFQPTPNTGHYSQDKMHQPADWAIERQLQFSQIFHGVYFFYPLKSFGPPPTSLMWFWIGQLFNCCRWWEKVLPVARQLLSPQCIEMSSLFIRTMSGTVIIVNSSPVGRQKRMCGVNLHTWTVAIQGGSHLPLVSSQSEIICHKTPIALKNVKMLSVLGTCTLWFLFSLLFFFTTPTFLHPERSCFRVSSRLPLHQKPINVTAQEHSGRTQPCRLCNETGVNIMAAKLW